MLNDGLSAFNCFEKLPQLQKDYLFNASQLINVSRAERLFENGNQCPGVFCLKSGRVRIGILAASGNERTVEIVFPGEIFGEWGIFNAHKSPVYAQAITQSSLLCISRRVILSGIRRWPEMSVVFLELACQRIDQLMSGMYVCCLRNAHQRVHDFLLENVKPTGQDCSQGIVALQVSKAMLASSLNLSAETFSRELHYLSERGLIKVDRSCIHVYNLEQLREQCIS